MTPWRRAPRAVYEVYGEDHYLAGEAPYPEDQPEPSSSGGESVTGPGFEASQSALDDTEPGHPRPAAQYHEERHRAVLSPHSHGSHSARFVGLGVLVLVTVCVLGLVVAHPWHRLPAAPRSGVTQSAQKALGRYTSAGVPIAGRTVQLSTSPISGEHAAVRSSVRAPQRARVEKHTVPGSSVAIVPGPSVTSAQAWSPASETLPPAPVSPADYEFGFER